MDLFLSLSLSLSFFYLSTALLLYFYFVLLELLLLISFFFVSVNAHIFYLKGLGGIQRLKTGTFLLFFFIYPMEYFIQTVYHIKDTYLISTL